jgi:hypothetical protein
MTEMTQPFETQPSWWRRMWAAMRSREVAPAAGLDWSVSFPELVWAHYERQKEVYGGVVNGPWEQEYRRRLKEFKAQHGQIVESYWCRFAPSGIALTQNSLPRRLTKFFQRDEVLRLHTATDWRTACAPVVASWLHRWETSAIKSSEVLRGTSERIALSWIFATSSRLLASVDRESDADAGVEAALQPLLADQKTELDAVNDYYHRAGDNSARIVYFRGMLWGTAVLAALVGGGFLAAWALDWLDPHDASTYTLFVTVAMGALGAILSVMTRMAKRDGFNLEFEVGRKSMRYLGGVRPWIGAFFALALYLALRSSLLEFFPSGSGNPHGIYYYSTIAFVGGFSERRAKVLLDSVGVQRSGAADAGTKTRSSAADDT